MNPLKIAIAYCEQGSGHRNRQETFAAQLRDEEHEILMVNNELALFDWSASFYGREVKKAERTRLSFLHKTGVAKTHIKSQDLLSRYDLHTP